MNTLAVGPEMFGQKVAAAPSVLVDDVLVQQAEDVQFNFLEYYEMLREAGVAPEDIASATLHYSSELTDKLGLYEPETRTVTVYAKRCIEAAQAAKKGEAPRHRGYKPMAPVFSTLVNDINIHETGHFQHDVTHPNYERNLRYIDRVRQVAAFLPMIGGASMAAMNMPVSLALPVMGGALGVTAGSFKAVSLYNPTERPAFRFERAQAGRKIVDFALGQD